MTKNNETVWNFLDRERVRERERQRQRMKERERKIMREKVVDKK